MPRPAWALEANEAELRAAVIVGILRFTSWPTPSNSDIRLCTLGSPLSEPVLLKLPKRPVVGARLLQTRELRSGEATNQCDVVVVGETMPPSAAKALLEDANHRGVLTVCDACDRYAGHSMIILTRKQNRIGFEVNLGIAQAKGLLFSSALLELAVKVRP